MPPFLKYLNLTVLLVLALSYLYQLGYTFLSFAYRRCFAEPEARENHRYAAVISARNEEQVIAGLVGSLKRQNYPAELLDIYVIADNCTDGTAQAAAAAGATVYQRQNREQVGKGYALDTLFHHIREDFPQREYTGFFVFDADNLVDPNFVSEMNKTYDRGGYDAITCYRNSKNFGSNWISAGYSIWFLRQARFLNFPRSLSGVSCAVGGTGFFLSARLLEENGGWPFHLLTEDIEFSADCVLHGRTIGYCDRAIIFDEQPTAFHQSWDQRLRWSKGFYQVDAKYGLSLLREAFHGGRHGFSCYDTLMNITPSAILLAVLAVIDGVAALVLSHRFPGMGVGTVGKILLVLGVGYYAAMFLLGFSTVLSEWRRIPAAAWEKLKYLPLFPCFMLTYLPIALTALVKKVEWKPIRHEANPEPEIPKL